MSIDFITTEKDNEERARVADLPSFNEVFLRHLPTKQGHNYNPLYERYFDPVREKVKRVLEIGIEAGTSLRMWADYFPNAEIYGFDIDPACKEHEDDRIHVVIGDQTSNDDLATLPDGFDIVIDDGLHSVASQISSFEYLFKNKMEDRGIYVVEDVIGAGKVFDYFNRLSHLVNYWPKGESGAIWSSLNDFDPYLAREKYSADDSWYIKHTLGVSIYRHLIFIDKGENPQHGQAAFRLQHPEVWGNVSKVRQKFLEESDFKLDKHSPGWKKFLKSFKQNNS